MTRTKAILILLVQLGIASIVSAQQSNLSNDYSALLPEVRSINKFLRSQPPSESALTKEGLQKARNGMKALAGGKPILPVAEKTIPGPAGNIPVRIFKPDTIRGVVLDIHGGAWMLGEASTDDHINDEMARKCKVAIVSVDYRLSPESPFPACIEDCKAAARWLLANAKKEFGTDKIIISGYSAGAHLSAVTALYIRDSLHAIDKVKGLNLVYGCFDLGRTPSNSNTTDTTLILSKKSMDEVYQIVFRGWPVEKLRKPEYSPLYANLSGMPPAFFVVGTADPLLDDTNFMESRWRYAGNKTYLAIFPEGTHGFNLFPSKMAVAANELMHKWIIETIGKD